MNLSERLSSKNFASLLAQASPSCLSRARSASVVGAAAAAGFDALVFELALFAVEFAAGAPQADSPSAAAARNIAKLERFINGHLKVDEKQS